MTTARLYNILFETSDKEPWTAEYKQEQKQMTQGVLAEMRRTLTDQKLKYDFLFASRWISMTSRGEQAYMTPAALAAVQAVPGIEKIFPMTISAHPLSREL